MAISFILGTVTGSSRVTGISTYLILFPLLFASTAFIPENALLGWLQLVSAVIPIAYWEDAARVIMLADWTWDIIVRSLVVLGALDLTLGIVAVYFLNRASSSTVR